MCILTSIIAGIATAASAIASAASAAAGAVAGFLGTTIATVGGATITTGAAAGTVVGGTSITVGGVLAGVGLAASMAAGLGVTAATARASAKAQKAQEAAMQKLAESGNLEVNDTARTIQENPQMRRTLSSLRVPLGVTPKQDTEQVTKNVYGVDTNTVATATQNMTGLNITAA